MDAPVITDQPLEPIFNQIMLFGPEIRQASLDQLRRLSFCAIFYKNHALFYQENILH